MTSSESGNDTPPRKYKWRYGPLRLVMPWLAIAGGVLSVVRGVNDLQSKGDPLFIYVGVGLIVLAIVFFFVYRWQAKRGS